MNYVADMPAPVIPDERANALDLAVDVAERIALQSIDFAQHALGHGEAQQDRVLLLATSCARVAATVYAAHEQAAALREITPEIAGAISEAGTDIGAGIAEGLAQAFNANKNDSTNNT